MDLADKEELEEKIQKFRALQAKFKAKESADKRKLAYVEKIKDDISHKRSLEGNNRYF